MLLVPLASQESSVRPNGSVRRLRPAPPEADRASGDAMPRAPALLVAWAILGAGVMFCVPSARGGGALGGTLPFWLVAAPLIDLAWCKRRTLSEAFRRGVRAWRSRRRAAAVRCAFAVPSSRAKQKTSTPCWPPRAVKK